MNTFVINYKSNNKKAIYRGRVSIAHYKIHPPTTFFLIIYYLHYIHTLFQATFYIIFTLFQATLRLQSYNIFLKPASIYIQKSSFMPQNINDD